MNGLGLITLLTDFGLDDPYVGVLKAVLLQGCPTARIVDLSHALQPYDADGAVGDIFALFGSFGTLELAMREGHAATALGVSSGTLVELHWVGCCLGGL
jgi:S-adenosylmethionine hydrolase